MPRFLPQAQPVSDPAQVTTLTMRSGNNPHRQDEGRLSFYEPIVRGGLRFGQTVSR